MNIEKWQEIKNKIKDSFKVEEEEKTHAEEAGGIDSEYLIFQGPLGRMKLEFISKPVVLDKKTKYSKRIGSLTTVEYVYGEEKVNKLHVYKWDEGQNDWLEIEAKNFNLLLTKDLFAPCTGCSLECIPESCLPLSEWVYSLQVE